MGSAAQSAGAIGIVVPVLDEAAALPALLEEVRAAGLLPSTVFVDNGSTDGSPELIEAAGSRLLCEAHRGYGYPCLTGSRAVTAAGARVIVFMEADGSDDPVEVTRLAAPVLDGSADLVIGSRRRAVRAAGGMPPHQRLGNALARASFRILFGLSIADNGPLRAVRADLLQRLHMRPRAYAWTTEMTVKAHLLGARIAVVETGYRRRAGVSKIAGTVTGTLGAFVGIFGTMLWLRLCSASGRRGTVRRAIAVQKDGRRRSMDVSSRPGLRPRDGAGRCPPSRPDSEACPRSRSRRRSPVPP